MASASAASADAKSLAAYAASASAMYSEDGSVPAAIPWDTKFFATLTWCLGPKTKTIRYRYASDSVGSLAIALRRTLSASA